MSVRGFHLVTRQTLVESLTRSVRGIGQNVDGGYLAFFGTDLGTPWAADTLNHPELIPREKNPILSVAEGFRQGFPKTAGPGDAQECKGRRLLCGLYQHFSYGSRK